MRETAAPHTDGRGSSADAGQSLWWIGDCGIGGRRGGDGGSFGGRWRRGILRQRRARAAGIAAGKGGARRQDGDDDSRRRLSRASGGAAGGLYAPAEKLARLRREPAGGLSGVSGGLPRAGGAFFCAGRLSGRACGRLNKIFPVFFYVNYFFRHEDFLAIMLGSGRDSGCFGRGVSLCGKGMGL